MTILHEVQCSTDPSPGIKPVAPIFYVNISGTMEAKAV